MTARVDIVQTLNGMKPLESERLERVVLCGPSAMRALAVELDGEAPVKFQTTGGREFRIVETTDFDGWDIVDQPKPSKRPFSLAGKRRA